MTEKHLIAALGDIIEGRIVKRSKHELVWNGRDVSGIFCRLLPERGFEPLTVGSAEVQPGERAPAFIVEGGFAYFGWVFWEKFTDKWMRKLYGSDIRNEKGDWAIQIPPTRDTVVYVNMAMKVGMDIDNPRGM